MERSGRYLLIDEIGSGGMASVHLGRLVGPAGFGRTVAIKRLHPHLGMQAEFVAMLLDEARIACRLYHPNVVQVLDILTEGRLWLVLEYVHGESLSRLAKRRRERGELLDPSVAVAVVVNVLRGLHAAHEMTAEDGSALGLVHRDVSPHNVLVSSEGMAKILDFGIAKAQGRIQTTGEGQVKGKLAYMAPEQIENRSIDRRADIYAASVILWELLAGKRLFTAETQGELVAEVLRGGIESPRVTAPAVSEELSSVVLRGLALEPDERYGSARELADALEAACPVAAPARIAEWVTRDWPEGESRRKRLAEVERIKPDDAASDSEDTESAVLVTVPKAQPVDPFGVTKPAGEDDSRIESTSRRRWIYVSVALAIAFVGIPLGWQWLAPRAPIATVPPPEATTSSSASTSVVVETPLASSTTTSTAAVASAPPSAKPVVPRTTAAKPSSQPKSSPECEPPFTLDANGNHVWKRECFP
jgi:serine/threonine protein kinase